LICYDTTIIEAMLAGVPVVAKNVGGVGEMVVHGETGYLVQGPDIGPAVEHIKELAGNGELRAKMGLAGRKRAKELFDLDTMIARYEKLYS
jgi:glycosyltransferase involved in cell wall biosynthesis